MQNGILKSFAPLQEDGIHAKWNENYKFVVEIDENGKPLKGVALAQRTTGSKAWKIGEKHEYNKKENHHAEGGYSIQGLKCIVAPEQTSSFQGPSAFDIKKESYVISRFAHQFALDYLNTLPQEEREKLIKDLGAQGIVGKLSKTMAKSVHQIAIEVQKMNEGGHKEAS